MAVGYISVSPVEVGEYTYIGNFTHISQYTKIGRFCSIANLCTIGAQPHDMSALSTYPPAYFTDAPAPKFVNTTIGNDVWIGANSVIIGGVKIGDGAVIGAGSVVTKDVPSYAIVVGNPARFLRYRFSQLRIEQLLESRWWELPIEIVKTLPFADVGLAIEMVREIRKVAA